MGGAARGIVGHPDRALIVGGRMARGCELCFPGLKAVVFVTGLCDDGCFYCPVDRDKLGRDVFRVNEEPVNSVEEAVLEVARQGAEGASLTGGDPLARPERTLRLVEAFKEAFGHRFHIHLYTSGRYATPSLLAALDRAGLDEIRFHPTRREFMDRVGLARRLTGMSVGVEIPIAPGMEEWAKWVISEAERLGAEFVNLNEMEFVAPNAEQLTLRGYTEDPGRPFTVKGALKAALRVLEWARDNAGIPVHFCPARFKDAIQTRNRLRRLARLDARWFEEPTGQGTLVWGELRRPRLAPEVGEECGPETYCLPPDRELLAAAARLYGGEAYIVEAYPTRDRSPVVGEERIA
ncbi:radical SAM protein [Stetteria hydrogenophila]